ncbi:hypothetical protein L210DRAFT_938738, partial [Boletus edulis BED1]
MSMSIRELYARDVQGRRGEGIDTGLACRHLTKALAARRLCSWMQSRRRGRVARRYQWTLGQLRH